LAEPTAIASAEPTPIASADPNPKAKVEFWASTYIDTKSYNNSGLSG